MARSIHQVVRLCLSAFRSLLALQDGGLEDEDGTQVVRLQDDFARFKVWAGNIGAHRTGRGSLEYRLRDASHIRIEVLRLLEELSELLDDGRAILKGERVPWDKLPADEDEDDEDSFPSTEIEQIIRNISDIISCLLRLSVAIRNPAPHDWFRTSHDTDTSHYEPYDISHVQTKFPAMELTIAERLGRAISRRRQYFKYRESHHTKLAEGLEALEGLDLGVARKEELQSTVASSIPDAVRQNISFNAQANAVNEDDASVTGVSQTSFATSVFTPDKLSVPPLPAEAQNGPFECPFCFMMISATTTLAWKKHVFRDLRPHICLHRDCKMPDQKFGRRHEWMDHVLQYHWKIWSCPSTDCSETFNSAASCETHVDSIHPKVFTPSQLRYAVQFGERPLDPEQRAQCPICDAALTSLKEYQKHVARHQEQLALFALPNTNIQESEAKRLRAQVMQVLEVRKTKLGVDHRSTLRSMANLASTYWDQGRSGKAEKPEMQVLEARKTKLGVDHPDTVTSMASLAITYRDQGRLEEAEKLQMQVLEAHKTKLGIDHPDTLSSIAILASTYRRQGRLEEAEKLQMQVLEARKTKLGVDHPRILISMASLALTYGDQGRLEEAEKLQMQVLEARKTKLGVNHPSTLTSMAHLALTYEKLGRGDEAEKLQMQVGKRRGR